MSIQTDLNRAIAALYDIFQSYRAVFPLHACDCPICMPEEMMREMVRMPLKQLSANYFYEYNNAPCDISDKKTYADEIKYFLPRWFELLIQGERLHHSPKLFLSRLRECFPDYFSDSEREAVQHTANLLFRRRLHTFPWQDDLIPIHGSLFSSLAMFHIGGIDIRPMLADWRRTANPTAAAHYVDNMLYYKWDIGIDNPFIEDDDFKIFMLDWIEHPDHRRHFAEQILITPFPDSGDNEYRYSVWRWRDAAGFVFDQITF